MRLLNVLKNLTHRIPKVIDNLTSTSTTDALSANMGKQLNDKVSALGTATPLANYDFVNAYSQDNPAWVGLTNGIENYKFILFVYCMGIEPAGTEMFPSSFLLSHSARIIFGAPVISTEFDIMRFYNSYTMHVAVNQPNRRLIVYGIN